MMTEGQAWRAVAKHIDAMGGVLCIAVLHVRPAIPLLIRGRMVDRIYDHLGPNEHWAYPPMDGTPDMITENRKARVMAALWLALEAEHEQ
jgi:hypothetical protein